jgi:hypothetical protein
MKIKLIIFAVLAVLAVLVGVVVGGGGGFHRNSIEIHTSDPQAEQQRELKDFQQHWAQTHPLTGPGSDPCNSQPC